MHIERMNAEWLSMKGLRLTEGRSVASRVGMHQ